MPYRNGQQGMDSGLQPINVKLYISLHPDTKPRDPPQSGSVTHSCQLRNQQNFLGLWWDSHLSFKEHISALKTKVQGGSQSHPSCCTLEVGRGQRHTADAVPDHCSFKARLWMYCVWHSIQYQFTTTWQHPQRWAKTGTRGMLHQPSLQYVHGGQRSSFGGTSVEVVHELLSENSCLHWQPSTSCTTWIWPNHKRSVSS